MYLWNGDGYLKRMWLCTRLSLNSGLARFLILLLWVNLCDFYPLKLRQNSNLKIEGAKCSLAQNHRSFTFYKMASNPRKIQLFGQTNG